MIITSGLKTLEEAKAARHTSGDLVVVSGTNEILIDVDWLWPNEAADVNCWAYRAILWQQKQNA